MWSVEQWFYLPLREGETCPRGVRRMDRIRVAYHADGALSVSCDASWDDEAPIIGLAEYWTLA